MTSADTAGSLNEWLAEYDSDIEVGHAGDHGSEHLHAVRVTITYPAKRCCAPGCGDKIKGDGDVDDTMLRVHWDDGSVSHLEEQCLTWFEDGQPAG